MAVHKMSKPCRGDPNRLISALAHLFPALSIYLYFQRSILPILPPPAPRHVPGEHNRIATPLKIPGQWEYASISSRHRHALKALHNSAQGWRACEPTLGHMPQLYPPFGRGGSGRGGSQTGDQSPFMLLHLPAPRHVPGEYKMRFMIFFSHLEKWQRKSYR